MKHGLGVLALLFAVAADAAEPPVASSAPASNAPAPRSEAKSDKPPPARKPLDLRVGSIRNYMMPKDYLDAVTRPDADQDTVVVEGQRELAPMKQVEQVPGGLASLGYAATNPLNAWRIFAPVVDPRATQRPSVIPPPIFRLGP